MAAIGIAINNVNCPNSEIINEYGEKVWERLLTYEDDNGLCLMYDNNECEN